MAWEISHGADAWSTAYENLQNSSVDWLREACAAAGADIAVDETEADWLDTYESLLGEYGGLHADTLADMALRYIEHWNTCDNGGFNFYIDQDGHYSVSVDLIEG